MPVKMLDNLNLEFDNISNYALLIVTCTANNNFKKGMKRMDIFANFDLYHQF